MASFYLRRLLLGLCCASACGLVVPLSATKPAAALAGLMLPRASSGEKVDLGGALSSSSGKTLLVLGTYAADFNMVEYCQRIRAVWPQLQEKGISRCMMVVNAEASAALKLAELVGLPSEVELYADPTGEAGRRFGVSRGWKPDAALPAFVKLFVMGVVGGPGSWMTLPAVISGYVGNPSGRREWIEAALKQGQMAGRWPSVLELAADDSIVSNRFSDTPLVSGWGVRPFELATLRLQNLIGVQGQHWEALKPVDLRCLTQLGGCTVVSESGESMYSWIDQGLCDVPDMNDVLDAL